jgi:hypothetical protein
MTRDMFGCLVYDVHFEEVAKGRRGAVLLKKLDTETDALVPLVRSTTKYSARHQWLGAAHANVLSHLAFQRVPTNNILIEQYTWEYRAMGAHSDQCLDLDLASDIALLTLYSDPDNPRCDKRKLVIVHKTTGEQRVIVLEHGSCVVFSVEQNAEFLHRIVPVSDDVDMPNGTTWLGLTCRCSKRRVAVHSDGNAFLESGQRLQLAASKEQARPYYKARSVENGAANTSQALEAWACAHASCLTISPSDVMVPSAAPGTPSEA